MRRLLLCTLATFALVLFGDAALAQTSNSPTTGAGEPEGAADNSGLFNPMWIVVIGIGFAVFVLVGLLTRRSQRRPPAP